MLDVIRVRNTPSEVKRLVKATATQDGVNVAVRWEKEPGSAGKFVSSELVQLLVGFDAWGVAPRGDKVQRSGPMAAQTFAGNVKLL